jgi:hypothetical protein
MRGLNFEPLALTDGAKSDFQFSLRLEKIFCENNPESRFLISGGLRMPFPKCLGLVRAVAGQSQSLFLKLTYSVHVVI